MSRNPRYNPDLARMRSQMIRRTEAQRSRKELHRPSGSDMIIDENDDMIDIDPVKDEHCRAACLYLARALNIKTTAGAWSVDTVRVRNDGIRVDVTAGSKHGVILFAPLDRLDRHKINQSLFRATGRPVNKSSAESAQIVSRLAKVIYAQEL